MGLAIQRMVLEGARASGEQAGREARGPGRRAGRDRKLCSRAPTLRASPWDVLDEQIFEGALKALERL